MSNKCRVPLLFVHLLILKQSTHLLVHLPHSSSTRLLLRFHSSSWHDPLVRVSTAAHQYHLPGGKAVITTVLPSPGLPKTCQWHALVWSPTPLLVPGDYAWCPSVDRMCGEGLSCHTCRSLCVKLLCFCHCTLLPYQLERQIKLTLLKAGLECWYCVQYE